MDARELRLGNLVRMSNGLPVVIDRDDFPNYPGVSNIEDYHPIPLTPEILEKCGFSHLHMNPRLERFYVTYQSYSPFVVMESRDGYFFLDGREIKYLHTLQNIYFAFTGEELEIKL